MSTSVGSLAGTYTGNGKADRRLAPPPAKGVPHGATQDPAQHVAAPLVGRENPVGYEKGDGARMVGQHSERGWFDAPPAGARSGSHRPTLITGGARRTGREIRVRLAHQLFDSRDEREKKIGVVVGSDPLEHRGDSLQPGARVHRRSGERDHFAARLPVVLHEDQVPDLEEATRFGAFDEGIERELPALGVSPLARGAGRERPVARDVREVHVDLRARPAGTGVGHLPEIVAVAQRVDARVGKARDLAPQ